MFHIMWLLYRMALPHSLLIPSQCLLEGSHVAVAGSDGVGYVIPQNHASQRRVG